MQNAPCVAITDISSHDSRCPYVFNYGGRPKLDLEPIGDGWYAERSECE